MQYQITVDELVDRPDARYPDKKEVYQQTVQDLDVTALVTFINSRAKQPVLPDPVFT